MTATRRATCLLGLAACLLATAGGLSTARADEPLASVASIRNLTSDGFRPAPRGTPSVQVIRDGVAIQVTVGMTLKDGDAVQTTSGVVLLRLSDRGEVIIGEYSEVTLGARLRLLWGRLVIRLKRALTVETTEVEIVDVGTVYELEVDPRGEGAVVVVEGSVEVGVRHSSSAPVRVDAGEKLTIEEGQTSTPRPLTRQDWAALDRLPRAMQARVLGRQHPLWDRLHLQVGGGLGVFAGNAWGQAGVALRGTIAPPLWFEGGLAIAGRGPSATDARGRVGVSGRFGPRVMLDLSQRFVLRFGLDAVLLVGGYCAGGVDDCPENILLPGVSGDLAVSWFIHRGLGLDLDLAGGVHEGAEGRATPFFRAELGLVLRL